MTRTTRRKSRVNCECLEGRQLLSLSGTYYVVNAASGLVLDDPGFSTSNGAIIQQQQLNGGTNQQWSFVPLANGNYEVRNAYSDKVLEDPKFSTSNGTQIIQYTLNGGANQQWLVAQQLNGNYYLFNSYSGKALENDPYYSTSAGTPIEQGELKLPGTANQQWILLAASHSSPIGPEYIVNSSSSKVLDDPDFSTANGALIEQSQYNGGTNQQWTLVPLADGNYVIINGCSFNVLEDPDFSPNNRTQMDQWQLNGGTNQQWKLVPDVVGEDELINAYSGKLLDDANFSTKNGNPIIQYQFTGGMNQEWELFWPNSTYTTTRNWAGYVAETNFAQPQSNSVSYVGGNWAVPTVTGPSRGRTMSMVWVGIDGNNNNNVEQIGTEQEVVNGTAQYYAFWEMFAEPAGEQQLRQKITSMTVKPGDWITAGVDYVSSGAHAGQFFLFINDDSRPNDSFTTYQSVAPYHSLPQRDSAEWIVEAPCCTLSGGIEPLADFGSVSFGGAVAAINGVIGPINAPSWQSQAQNMTPLDTTSVLTNSGQTFSVLANPGFFLAENPSVEAAVRMDTNVAARTQTGPGVGATFQSGQKTGSPVIGGPAEMGASFLSRFRKPIGQNRRPAQEFLGKFTPNGES
jgi:hypothetical protein